MAAFQPSVYSNPTSPKKWELDLFPHADEGLAVGGLAALAATGLLAKKYGVAGAVIGVSGSVLAVPLFAIIYSMARD